ncbi:MAG: hypothetical protein WC364_05700 [Eubacteriales bacterium]|jgi:hypothetical protein
MPIKEIDSLEPDSEDPTKKAALSACIATKIREGIPQEQAVAECMEMVKSKTEVPSA